MSLRVCVLGAGSWGTTVASLAVRNTPTLLWARRADTADEINRAHTNERYLSKVKLPRALRATASIEEAVRDADVIAVGVPSHGQRAVLEEVRKFIRPWVPLVSLGKGLEQGTHSAHDPGDSRGAAGSPCRRAHRPEPRARDHVGPRRCERDRDRRRHDRAPVAGRLSQRSCFASTPTATSSAASSAAR